MGGVGSLCRHRSQYHRGCRYNVAPSMGGEDFSFMLNARPGEMLWLGNGPSEDGCLLHNARYEFNDAVLSDRRQFLARLAERFLESPPRSG